MRIVAIETTESIGSVAAMEADRPIAQLSLPAGQRSAESLAPTIAQLLHRAAWQPPQVDLVAVSVGPGSFTGLRVGVTTAKAFAYAVEAEIIAVPTLDATACQAPRDASPLWAVGNAYRQQVFAGRVPLSQRQSIRHCDQVALLTIDEWLHLLRKGDWVTGPGLTMTASQLPTGIQIVDRSLWPPTAAMVGRVGWSRYQAGRRDDLWQLVPCYLRKSAAEEKWLEQQHP
jgi:tRNA threonylcarbamoyladenosine biosynthesis protein TsaB